MTDFLKKKKVNACECSALKNSIYQHTYNEHHGNSVGLQNVDILILLEFKETSAKLNTFLSLCTRVFDKYSYVVIPALGCTPENFSSQDTVNTYRKCKELHIKKIVQQYSPKVIITTGRALYTITESKELRCEHFFIPVNEFVQPYDTEDSFLFTPEFNCRVFPIPALYQWIADTTVKDIYEYKFVIQQFKRSIDALSSIKRRSLTSVFTHEQDPNKFISTLLIDPPKVIAIDTESSGLNYFVDELYSIQFSINNNSSHFCFFNEIDSSLLNQLFENTNITFVFHNAQHDLRFLKQNKITSARCDFDTMLAAHILNENSPNGLKPLTWMYTQYGGYEKEVKQYLSQNNIKNFKKIPIKILLKYACYDSMITFQLYEYFNRRLELEDPDVKHNFYNYVMPAVEMIHNVEMTGVQLDFTYLKKYTDTLKIKALEIENELYAIAGYKFNLNSGKELSKVLRNLPDFKVLTDETGKPLLTKNGDLKLDKETLLRYATESNLIFMKKISEYNHYIKEISQLGVSTAQIEERPSLFPEEEKETTTTGFLASVYKGRLYGGYKLHGTETGRMSGGGGLNSTINWQNMPKTKEFRMLFLPSKGAVFGTSDYDAMEVCIASQIAGPGVLEQLILENKDMHCYTAVQLMEMLGVQTTYEEVVAKTKVEGQEDAEFLKYRADAKGVNFSGLYGSTEYGMASSFGVSIEDGKKFLNAFYLSYPEIKKYMDEYRAHAKKYGYVKTLLGRKKRLPQLTYIGKDSFTNYQASYSINNLLNTAINAPIQGTSGQVTLIAMTNIWKEFKKQNLKSRVLINVHDEIVTEIFIDELEIAKSIIKKYMELPYYTNVDGCKVQLTAGLVYGELWKYGKSKEYWNTHPEEWEECLENIEKRNTNNILS